MKSIKKLLVNNICGSSIIPSKIRVKLYNLLGMNFNAMEIRDNVYFSYEFIDLGRGTFINRNVQFNAGPSQESGITIGENCYIGMNTNICCITHELGNSNLRAGNNIYKPINIKNGCWIGANSIILPGITIEEGCVIGAGSVVNKDCEPNYLYAGNPAKKIKKLD